MCSKKARTHWVLRIAASVNTSPAGDECREAILIELNGEELIEKAERFFPSLVFTFIHCLLLEAPHISYRASLGFLT